MELASFSRRFLALGLDLLILSLPLSIILMTYAILNDLQLYAPYYQTGIDLVPEIVYRFYPVLLPTFSIWALVIFLYFWLTTFGGGQSIGKMLLKMRVIRLDASPCKLTCALWRTIFQFISVMLFFFGFFWAIFDCKRQSFHDKVVKTVVIRCYS